MIFEILIITFFMSQSFIDAIFKFYLKKILALLLIFNASIMSRNDADGDLSDLMPGKRQ